MCHLIGFALVLIYASALYVFSVVGLFDLELDDVDHSSSPIITGINLYDVNQYHITREKQAMRKATAFMNHFPVLQIFIAIGFIGSALFSGGYIINRYFLRYKKYLLLLRHENKQDVVDNDMNIFKNEQATKIKNESFGRVNINKFLYEKIKQHDTTSSSTSTTSTLMTNDTMMGKIMNVQHLPVQKKPFYMEVD